MAATWKADVAGNAALQAQLAGALDAFANRVRDNARTLSPHRWRNTGRYRRSIRASTFLNGTLFAGDPVRAIGFRPTSHPIKSIVYTEDFQGHMLEVTGARPHDIPIPISGSGSGALFLIIKHPGFTRKPHFVPGLLMASAEMGVAITRGKRLAMAGKYGR